MRAILSCIVVVCVGSVYSKSLPLPSYITPCFRDLEPKEMTECALKNGRAAMPKFMGGDRKYKVPNLNPILISRLHVNEGVLGLNLTATDAKLYGLPNTILNDIEMDIANQHGRYGLVMPRIEIACDYEIEGRILILPITGKGPGNITLTDMHVNYTFDWDLVKHNKGYTFIKLKNTDLNFNTSRLYVKLDNLFNGNKLLGDQMNEFMDESWKDLIKDIGPVIGEAMSETMRTILQNIFELVSYDNAFPYKPVSK